MSNRRLIFMVIMLILVWIGSSLIYFASDKQVEDNIQNSQPLGFGFTNNYPPINKNVIPDEITNSDGSYSIILHEEENWRLLRNWPSGYLDVSYRNEVDIWTRLPLSSAWRRSQIPLLAFASTDGDYLNIVTYDARSNIPSGRSLKPSREGLDLYRVTTDSREEPDLFSSSLPLGGFDTRLFANQSGKDITICGGNKCLVIDEMGKYHSWNLDAISNHEIIELVFSGDNYAYALTRLQHDDRHNGFLTAEFSSYYGFLLTPSNSQLLSTFTSGGVPWGLTLESNAPTLRIANNATDLSKLLRYDLALMPFSGVMDFGSNNLEGRLAWSSVYYLNGLISLIYNQNWINDSEIDVLKARLTRELQLIAMLANTKFPNYLSKRYSIDREPMLVALHVGRILQLVSRAQRNGINSKASVQSRNLMCEALMRMELTLEESRNLTSGETYLYYRKGFPFWADGANVPYNYVSGVIAGRLEAGCITVSEARKYLQPILRNEFTTSLPEMWRYWFGEGDNGWSEMDNISLNTSAYKGNGGALAHISYRSMDVVALLLFGHLGGDLPVGFKQHIEHLISRGSLFPSVNEALLKHGRTIQFDDYAVRRYARSIAPWELQNQVWALAFLAENAKE